MADKTTGGLEAVQEAAIGSLPGIADLYDETLIPVEQQGEARHMTGAQWKRYAQAGVSKYVEDAQNAANDAQKAVAAVGDAVEDAAASAEAAKDAREGAETARKAIEDMEVSARRPQKTVLCIWLLDYRKEQKERRETQAPASRALSAQRAPAQQGRWIPIPSP